MFLTLFWFYTCPGKFTFAEKTEHFIGLFMTVVDRIKCRYAHSGMTSGVGGFQNPGVCLQAFPSFLLHPLPAYSRHFSRGLCSETARKRLLRRLGICLGLLNPMENNQRYRSNLLRCHTSREKRIIRIFESNAFLTLKPAMWKHSYSTNYGERRLSPKKNNNKIKCQGGSCQRGINCKPITLHLLRARRRSNKNHN